MNIYPWFKKQGILVLHVPRKMNAQSAIQHVAVGSVPALMDTQEVMATRNAQVF